MLALYHGANSVCSVKVRIVLAEKGLEWESRHIDLPKGEQFSEAFRKVNPAAIVPVLEHDGKLIYESSVISEYVDTLSDENPLMPDDPYLQAKTRTWGILTLGYHDAVNTLTFASYMRPGLLKKSPEERAARWAAMPDRIKARKTADLVENGAASDYVPIAFGRLSRMCEMIDADLAGGPWLMGEKHGLADAMLAAYFFRLECVGVQALWENRFPRTTDWFNRLKERPSMAIATEKWVDAKMVEAITAAGRAAFLSDDAFAEFLT